MINGKSDYFLNVYLNMNPITVDYFNNMIKELDNTTYYSNNNVPLKRTKPVLKSQFEDIDIYKNK